MRTIAVVVILALFLACAAMAHPILAASAVATVSRDATLEITIRCDVLAFAMDAQPQTVDDAAMLALLNGSRDALQQRLEASRDHLAREFEAIVDGARIESAHFVAPAATEVQDWRASHESTPIPVKLEYAIHADLPRDSSRFAVRFPAVMGDIVLTVQTPGEEPIGALVAAGERSDEFRYNLHAPVVPGTAPPGVSSPRGTSAPALDEHAAPTLMAVRSPLAFIRMGFEHIVPEGLDHILFVLGLFFLSPRIRPLLIQITCFTLAHSVTLALSARGVVSLPSSIIEPMIAASIALIAIENLRTQRVRSWRLVIVFAFGLIHGLGFASAFAETLGTSSTPLGPVLLFNIGVECGQLAVIAAALLAVGWFRRKRWYRPAIAIPASLAIAGVGLYWTVSRIAGG
jgi:hypothetical protein